MLVYTAALKTLNYDWDTLPLTSSHAPVAATPRVKR